MASARFGTNTLGRSESRSTVTIRIDSPLPVILDIGYGTTPTRIAAGLRTVAVPAKDQTGAAGDGDVFHRAVKFTPT
jgi:hypothetical protein